MAEQRVTAIVSGSYAWDMRDGTAVVLTRPYLDGVPYNELRQLELAITPHGFLKAALAASDAKAIRMQLIGASDFGLSQFGRTVTIVSFTFLGKYKINGTIDDRNLVELVGTWFPNPVYRDMDYEMRYTEYKDVGGIKFPMLLHTHQGDPRVNVAHNYYEYRVTSVKPNAAVAAMPVPDMVRTAGVPPARVDSQRLADGVWLLGGGTHNSLLVAFRDYVAVVDAPNNEERSLAVIAEAARLRTGQADSVRHQHPPPLRPRRWAPYLSFAGHHDRHTRDEQAVLPGHPVPSGATHAAAGPHGAVQPHVLDKQAPSTD